MPAPKVDRRNAASSQSLALAQKRRFAQVRGRKSEDVSDRKRKEITIEAAGMREVNLSIALASFNCNSKGPPPERQLSSWLGSSARAFDVIAIGLQELDMRASRYFFEDEARRTAWLARIETALRASEKPSSMPEYVLVAFEQMFATVLFVYVKRNRLPYVREVKTWYYGCGACGFFANKGAVAIRMTIGGRSICIVNAHLAAHQHNVKRRNEDAQSILQGLWFQREKVCCDACSCCAREATPLSILQHDLVVFMGDLNYRLDIPADVTQQLLQSNERGRSGLSLKAEASPKRDLAALMKHDQLSIEMQMGRVFRDFSEPLKPSFDPTYKYFVGSDRLDPTRQPGWCDRVLYRTRSRLNARGLTVAEYSSFMNITTSDHKPVRAVIEITVDSTIFPDDVPLVLKDLPVRSSGKSPLRTAFWREFILLIAVLLLSVLTVWFAVDVFWHSKRYLAWLFGSAPA